MQHATKGRSFLFERSDLFTHRIPTVVLARGFPAHASQPRVPFLLHGDDGTAAHRMLLLRSVRESHEHRQLHGICGTNSVYHLLISASLKDVVKGHRPHYPNTARGHTSRLTHPCYPGDCCLDDHGLNQISDSCSVWWVSRCRCRAPAAAHPHSQGKAARPPPPKALAGAISRHESTYGLSKNDS